MNLLLFNLGWMAWNLMLAFAGLFFAYFALRLKNKVLKWVLFILAVLFSPNTIYITTDLVYLPKDWYKASLVIKPFLIVQYISFISLGVISFFLVVKELEKYLANFLHKKLSNSVLISLNFLIAFGVVIGRVQRANSWHVFTKPFVVLNNIAKTLTSVELMFYVVLFGLFANLIYFSFRKRFGVGERT